MTAPLAVLIRFLRLLLPVEFVAVATSVLGAFGVSKPVGGGGTCGEEDGAALLLARLGRPEDWVVGVLAVEGVWDGSVAAEAAAFCACSASAFELLFVEGVARAGAVRFSVPDGAT